MGENNERPQAGTVYIAPDDFHMGISRGGRIVLTQEEKRKSLRPSVAYLFESLAKHFAAQTVAVMLTGMGSDGADEMKMLKDGGSITIAQSEASSTIFGMPKAAIDKGGATFVLDTVDISRKLVQVLKAKR
jgi:two-component system chemotaxis response regulator CheB